MLSSFESGSSLTLSRNFRSPYRTGREPIPGAKARNPDLPRSRSLNFSPRCRVAPFILTTNAIISPKAQTMATRPTCSDQREYMFGKSLHGRWQTSCLRHPHRYARVNRGFGREGIEAGRYRSLPPPASALPMEQVLSGLIQPVWLSRWMLFSRTRTAVGTGGHILSLSGHGSS